MRRIQFPLWLRLKIRKLEKLCSSPVAELIWAAAAAFVFVTPIALLVFAILLSGCAAPDYSHLTFEQRMQVYEASKLSFPPIQPVYYIPVNGLQQPQTCMAIANNMIQCF